LIEARYVEIVLAFELRYTLYEFGVAILALGRHRFGFGSLFVGSLDTFL
jgi:hypothetical protein